jgi:hypothetical protein
LTYVINCEPFAPSHTIPKIFELGCSPLIEYVLPIILHLFQVALIPHSYKTRSFVANISLQYSYTLTVFDFRFPIDQMPWNKTMEGLLDDAKEKAAADERACNKATIMAHLTRGQTEAVFWSMAVGIIIAAGYAGVIYSLEEKEYR